MVGIVRREIGMLVSLAQEGLQSGKEVALLAEGIAHPLTVTAITHAGPDKILLVATAKYAQDEGATYTFPTNHLQAIRIAEQTYT